jgi:hypothetical protein
MALLLVVVGAVLMIIGYFTIGLILLVVGLIVWLFVPGVPYGYGSWRRGP